MNKIVLIVLISLCGCSGRLARIESKIDYCMEKYNEIYEDRTEEEVERDNEYAEEVYRKEGLWTSRIELTRPLIEGWKEKQKEQRHK